MVTLIVLIVINMLISLFMLLLLCLHVQDHTNHDDLLRRFEDWAHRRLGNTKEEGSDGRY